MKIAIVYHSESGNSKFVAEEMASETSSMQGIEIRAIDVLSPDESFLKESAAIVFGCPTYCGTMSWQLKRFLDNAPVALKGKLGSAFATENYVGGGADVAELAIVGCLLVHGMIVYTGGAMESPATHLGAVVVRRGTDEQLERARAFTRKIAVKARELFGE
jgi:NAD(P)H dehydrogenase (quinone)